MSINVLDEVVDVQIGNSPGQPQTGNTYQFQYDIAVASDFPTLLEVKDFFVYRVTAPVTDNDPTKTNTGQSFPADVDIYWDSGVWYILSQDLIFIKSGNIISKAVPTDTMDMGTGDTILYTIKAKNTAGLKFYNSGSELILDLKDDKSVEMKSTLTIDEPTTDSKIIINDSSQGSFPVMDFYGKSGGFGTTTIFNSHPGSLSTSSRTAFNRNVMTSGNVVIEFYNGTGTGDDKRNCVIGGNTDTWFNNISGNVGIGTDTPGEKLEIDGNMKVNGITTLSYLQTLDDDQEIRIVQSLTTNAPVKIWFIIGDNSEWAKFRVSSGGTIIIDDSSSNVVTTDTDDKVCILYSGAAAYAIDIKNRLGASKKFICEVKYG
jgi:hypothetical protein